MTTQATPEEELITVEDLEAFSLEELEYLLLHMYHVLDKIFDAISGSAQGTLLIEEPSSHKAIRLEHDFKRIWAELKVVVDAVIMHGILAAWDGGEWNTPIALL